MNLLIVSDIYGSTLALKALVSKLVSKLSSTFAKPKIVDPYNGVDHRFETQEQAYHYFTTNIGLDLFTNQLKTEITDSPSPVFLIGFSIGASAIWRLSNSNISPNIQKAICFYGSQIRHHTQINPHFDLELVFPKKESHFDVQQLSNKLSVKPRVNCKSSNGLHGFMNPLSPNFNSYEYSKYLMRLQELIKHYL